MMLPVRRTGRQDGCLLESDRKQRFNLSIKHIKDVKFAPDLCHKNNGVKRVASSSGRPLSATEKDDTAIMKIKHTTTSHNSPSNSKYSKSQTKSGVAITLPATNSNLVRQGNSF